MLSAPATRSSSPRVSFEEIEIRTSDAVTLRAFVQEPEELRGTIILSHALLVRKSVFGRRDRPGLASRLVERGFRTIAFDFRGHGESSRRPDWSYDDLVRLDIPAVVDCARARGEDRPVLLLGHSLGGHVSLAAQASGQISVDAIIALGANVWQDGLEPSRLRRGAKRIVLEAMKAVARGTDRIPARRLRIGSDDASRRFVEDWARMAGEWRSADGVHDYMASLASVRIPVAAVVGDRDHVLCSPRSGEIFARRCGGPVEVFHTRASHMSLVDEGAVLDAVEWAFAQARP